MEGYIAQIMLWAANFAPRNWAFCQGQILPISSNQALFSLLGTTYGGNGQTTFALPNFAGRVPVGTGQGPGLSAWTLGEMLGAESVTLTQSQMPAHMHTVTPATSIPVSTLPGSLHTASTDSMLAASNQRNAQFIAAAETVGSTVSMQANNTLVNTSIAGAGAAISMHQPSLGMNFIICLSGIFPSRN